MLEDARRRYGAALGKPGRAGVSKDAVERDKDGRTACLGLAGASRRPGAEPDVSTNVRCSLAHKEEQLRK
eukprot:scaffold48809_cov75-Phaeocystis_antarctica.AAC.3